MNEAVEDIDVEDEGPSLADDLAAAWDDSEGDEGEEHDDGGVHKAEADEPRPGDDTDREPAGDKPVGKSDGRAVSAVEKSAKPEAENGAAQPDSEKPPVSWNAEAREAWKSVPKEARAYIHEREKQFVEGLRRSGGDAKRAQAMDQVLQPYGQYLAMNGGAAPALSSLLQAGANLQMGSPVQKAQMVAKLIEQYGVDINTLDNVLVGQAPPERVQQSSDVQRAVQEAVAPYRQMLDQFQNGQKAQAQQFQGRISQTLQQFSSDPKNEFYSDVKMDMADILDMAANRGTTMDLQTAYERACKLNPQISRIIETRLKSEEVARKRPATASIHGTKGGDGGGGSGYDIRSAIEDAWDSAGRV